MSKFLTPLVVKRLEDVSSDGRGTWELMAPLVYESDVAGIYITAPEGFVTDLASVPRVPFAYLLTGGLGHAAAVIHDCLYISHVVTRDVADNVFYEALLILGISQWRAWLMWAGVRVGGSGAWEAPGISQPVAPHAEFMREAP